MSALQPSVGYYFFGKNDQVSFKLMAVYNNPTKDVVFDNVQLSRPFDLPNGTIFRTDTNALFNYIYIGTNKASINSVFDRIN